jgi:hypothetical protein
MTLLEPKLAPGWFSIPQEPKNLSLDTLESIKRGIKDVREGRSRPWSEVKKELGL